MIPSSKLSEYALNAAHPEGGPKARGLLTLGFTAANWQIFEQALREQHLIVDATETPSTDYGRKWRIDAVIHGPNGRSKMIRSVWIIDHGTEVPRLISIYPVSK